MSNTCNITLPAMKPYQHEAFYCSERFSIIDGSTKSGKTLPMILWILSQAGGTEARNLWWVAPVYTVAEIAFRRMCSMLKKAEPTKAAWKSNAQAMTITLKNGSCIWFKSGDDPDNLYGEDVYAAGIDEHSRVKESAWHAVRSTLTATNGKARLVGNVKGRKNWAYHLGQRAKSGQLKGWRYSKFTSEDAIKAGLITPEEVDEARQTLPDHIFRELYMSEPSEDGSNPFGMARIAECIAPISTREPVCFGIDLARKKDWTVCIGLDADGAVCRFERMQGADWDVIEDRLASIIGDVPALADDTGVGDPIVGRLAKRCENLHGFTFTSQSKPKLIEDLILAVQRGETRFPQGPIVSELESFEYGVSGSRVTYSAPEGYTDDCVCSLALAVRCKASHAGIEIAFTNGGEMGSKEPKYDDGEDVGEAEFAEVRNRFFSGG